MIEFLIPRRTARASAARRCVGLLMLALMVTPVTHAADLVFVTNERSNDVSVIDAASRTVVRTFAVGKRPRGIHVSPDRKLIYVAVSGSPRLGPGADPDRAKAPVADRTADGIAVVDIVSGRLVRKIDVGSDPEEFDVSRDGRRLYVANEDEGTATCWEIESGRRIFRTPISAEPEGVRLHPTRPEVYVTCEAQGEVYALDAGTGDILAKIAVSGRPRTVTFSPDGARAHVPLEGMAEVAVINAGPHTIAQRIKISDRGALPMGSAVTADGRLLFVSTGRGNTVAVVDLREGTAIASIPVGQRPWGILLSTDGETLFTANGGSNDVSVIDVRSRKEVTRMKVGDGPWGIAIAPSRE